MKLKLSVALIIGLAAISAEVHAADSRSGDFKRTSDNVRKFGYDVTSVGDGNYLISFFGELGTKVPDLQERLELRLAKKCQAKKFNHYKVTELKIQDAYKVTKGQNGLYMDKSISAPSGYIRGQCLKAAVDGALETAANIDRLSKPEA